jgi:hypothetical protein
MTTTCTNPTFGITLAPGATTCWRCGTTVADPIGDIVEDWIRSPYPSGNYATLTAQENAGIRQLAEMAYEAGRHQPAEEVARLKAELEKANARVDDYESLHQADEEHAAFLQHELGEALATGDNLRAKLEAAERVRAVHVREALIELANRIQRRGGRYVTEREMDEVEAAVLAGWPDPKPMAAERRQPVDRERAARAAKAVINQPGGGCCYGELGDAILGAAKAEPAKRYVCRTCACETSTPLQLMNCPRCGSANIVPAEPPPAFIPAPTGEAPSERTLPAIEDFAGRLQWLLGELGGGWQGRPEVEALRRAADHAAQASRLREVGRLLSESREEEKRLAKENAVQVKRVRELEAEHATLMNGYNHASAERSNLQAEASRPCPADVMDDENIGRVVVKAWEDSPGFHPDAYAKLGKATRKLFGKGAK